MPQISVIVPVYGVEKYLQKCVDSILAQTFTDFELLLVDDGGNDSSGSICDEYLLADARAITIHQSNKGLSGARNTGIDLAEATSSSEWITFIDSDDSISGNCLELLNKTANDSKSEVVVASLSYHETFDYKIERKSTIVDTKYLKPDETYRETANSWDVSMIIACAKLYKTELFQGIRFPLGKIHEDNFTTHKLIFKANKIALVYAKLYNYYYKNPNSIMNTKWNPKSLDAFEALDSQLSYFKENNAKYAFKYVVIQYFCVCCGQINNIRKNKQIEYFEIEKKIKKRLTQLFIRYAFKYHISIDKYYEVYEILFPHTIKWICRIRNFPNKILMSIFGPEKYQKLKDKLKK